MNRPRHAIATLLLALALPVGAQGLGIGAGEAVEEEEGGLPALDLLPDGSIFQQVVLPRYDRDRRLTAQLLADRLTLVDRNTIRGEEIRLDFFHHDRSLRARIDMEAAVLDNHSILRSGDPVSLAADDFTARGTGLVYHLDSSRGMLLGPATATVNLDRQTAMHVPIRPAVAGAALLATAAVSGSELPRLSPAEIDELNQLAIPLRPLAESSRESSLQLITTSEGESRSASAALASFLAAAQLGGGSATPPDLGREVPEPGESGSEDASKLTRFSADEGIYFDSEAGVVILLKEVTVDHPEFRLSGADEAKIFLEKDEEPAANGEAPGAEEAADGDGGEDDGAVADGGGAKLDEMMGGADFGDPVRVVATGTLVVEKKPTEQDPDRAQASGRQMVYDLTNDTLVIRGGKPWIIAPDLQVRVVEPEGYITINLKTGKASAVGRVEGVGQINR